MDTATPEVRIETGPAGTVARVSGEVTVQSAALVRDALLHAFGAPGAVSVDLSGVSYADLSFFQLLCSAHKKAFKEGRQFDLTGNTGAVIQGLADEIGFSRSRGCVTGIECCWKQAAGK